MTRPGEEPAGVGYDAEVARATARAFAWDGVYCAALATSVIAGAERFAAVVAVPARTLRLAGFGVLGWAAWLGHRAHHGADRRHLQVVAGTNLAVVVLLIADEARVPTGARGWRAGLAVEVGGFAARQLQLLHRSHVP